MKAQYVFEDRGYHSDCWIWQGCKRGGYGMITNPNYNGTGAKMLGAHVVYYEQMYGPVPKGSVLDHLCFQRDCVNPEHLEAVTHTVNIRRGRMPVITEEIAKLIRDDLTAGMMQKNAALKYGISQATVSQIARGVTWK